VSAQHVSELLVEVGPLVEYSEIVEDGDGQSWGIAVDENTLIHACYEAKGHLLLLEAELTPLPHTAEIATRLLEFNHAMVANHGIWMSIDEPAGTVVQSMEIAVDGLTVGNLKQELDIFVQRLSSWRHALETVLRHEGATDAGTEPSPPPEGADIAVIRV
jgi:hypothetical protein